MDKLLINYIMKFAKYHFIQKQTRRNLAQKEYINDCSSFFFFYFFYNKMIVQVKYNEIYFP